MFSDSFWEGQERDINEDFPFDSDPYSEHYDYQSDSDLEDGSSFSEEEEEEPLEGRRDSQQRLEDAPDLETSQIVASNLPLPVETSEAHNGHRSTPFIINCFPIYTDRRPNNNLPRTGKVAVIRDMGAITCVRHGLPQRFLPAGRRFEAMLYFLYTGEIEFAPFSSDHRHDLPAQARTGDWSIGKPPSPSAKSVYRLADKVTSFTCVWLPLDLSGSVRYTGPQGASQGVYLQQFGALQHRGGSIFQLLFFVGLPLA